MESEEREAATGRSQNVVHVLPQSMSSVPRFLTAPLERVDPVSGGLQLVVVTADAEAAVAMAEAVLRLTGLGGIELFPVTTARRAARLMKGRPVHAIAGAPGDLADLIRGSHLKMQAVRTVVLAWVDDLLEGDPEATASLELVMTEVPKDAARTVVTERAGTRVDAFVERYLRRARRIDEREVIEGAEPIAIRYLTVSTASRAAALRRLLDEIDPPSAAIIAESDEDEAIISNLLRALGYAVDGTVQLSRGAVNPNTHAVIFFGIPATRAQLAAAAAANPVTMIALVQPRDVPALRRMAGGDVKPLTLPEAGKTARDRERALRLELEEVLASGVPAREILALEPLLDKHDGIEIAAAALRLLERERAARKSDAAASRISAPRFDESPATRKGPPDRGGRPTDLGRGRPERGGRPSNSRRGPSERGGRPGDPRRGPPGAARPPRGRP